MKKILSGLIFALFLVVTIVPNTYAQDDASMSSITLDQAIEMALNHNKSIRKVQYDIERGQEVRDSVAEDVKYIPSGQTDPRVAAAYTGLLATDLQLQMTKKNLEVEKDKVTLSVFNKYTSVLAAIKNLDLAELKFEKAKKDRQIAQISCSMGVASPSQLKQAEHLYKTSELSYELARKDLEKTYENFNSVVGLSLKERPLLVDDIKYAPLEIAELSSEVTRIIDGSPAIWLMEQQVDLYEVTLRLHNWADPTSEPYEAKEIDVDKAKVSAAESKEHLRNGLYNIYQAIVQLEDNYEIVSQAVNLSQEDFRVKELQYELGMLSKQEYLASELSLAEAENSFNNIVYQHEILKQTFYKPWAQVAE